MGFVTYPLRPPPSYQEDEPPEGAFYVSITVLDVVSFLVPPAGAPVTRPVDTYEDPDDENTPVLAFDDSKAEAAMVRLIGHSNATGDLGVRMAVRVRTAVGADTAIPLSMWARLPGTGGAWQPLPVPSIPVTPAYGTSWFEHQFVVTATDMPSWRGRPMTVLVARNPGGPVGDVLVAWVQFMQW